MTRRIGDLTEFSDRSPTQTNNKIKP